MLLPLRRRRCCGPAYQILTRLAARHDLPDTSLIWSALVALVATTFVGPIGWQWPTATVWILMADLAVIGAVAHYALIKALDYAEAGAVQPYSYTLLVWATRAGRRGVRRRSRRLDDRWAPPSSWRAASTPGTTTGARV